MAKLNLLLLTCLIISLSVVSYLALPSFQSYLSKKDIVNENEIDFWFKDYLKWHQTQRNQSNRRIIFVPTTSGLGDMVKGMLTLWYVSVLTNRVFLIKDRDNKMPLSTVLSHDAKKNFLYVPILDRVNGTNSERHLIKSRFPKEVLSALSGNITNVYVQAQYFVKNVNQLSDFNTNQKTLPSLSINLKKKIVHRLLDSSEALEIDVNNALISHGLCVAHNKRCKEGHSHYVGVHARLGAGIGEHNERRWGLLSNHYEKVASCFLKHVENISSSVTGKKKVFLATDTPIFIRLFNETIQKSRSSRYELSSLSSKTKHFKDMNKTDWNVFRDMHVEHIVLGHAKHIVSFQSGFSLTAYYRGSAESYKILSLRDCGFKR